MTLADTVGWAPAEGVTVRGTVVLLPGRGEHAGTYGRLGTRLAFDGYRVTVPLAEIPVRIPAGPGPVVLLGHDTGAVRALDLAGSLPVDAVIASGLPLAATVGATDPAPPLAPSPTTGGPPSGAGPTLPGAAEPAWAAELDSRTACPVHRHLLESDDRFTRGELHPPVVYPVAEPPVPVLVLHGEADRVAAPEAARAYTAKLPQGRFVLVAGARHDVLNDVDHRSVAAEVVQFLEWLRAGASTPALVRG
jgi:pimeloyl-ACP methyl ester carboxylesterase